jgi:hypothetical protein
MVVVEEEGIKREVKETNFQTFLYVQCNASPDYAFLVGDASACEEELEK